MWIATSSRLMVEPAALPISGGYVALHLALRSLEERGALHISPLTDSVAAISVGVVHGMPVLDLEYGEDSEADVDMNVVMTGSGRIVEVQATAEKVPFGRDTLGQLMDLAELGIGEPTDGQVRAVAEGAALGGA